MRINKQQILPRSNRCKTEKKEDRNMLPKLNVIRKFSVTGEESDQKEKRKTFDNQNIKNKLIRPEKEAKRYNDQNLMQTITPKNSFKVSKKKLGNSFIIVQQIGLNQNLSKLKNTLSGLDFASDQYQGLRDHNQDRILISTNIKVLGRVYSIFGVFDGHGGSMPSEFAKTHFVKMFEFQMNSHPMLSILQNLRKTIFNLENKICQILKNKGLIGGTCATILIISENKYYIAQVGDSRALQIKHTNGNYAYEQLTTDHKPDLLSERNRIESVGGKIYRNKINQSQDIFGPYRVFPGKLSVSRTLGDYDAKKMLNGSAITWQPQLLQGDLHQECIFLLFSDGAYEKFENKEIVEYFTKQRNLEETEIRKSIQTFLLNCILRQNNDNVSIIAVQIKQQHLRSLPRKSFQL